MGSDESGKKAQIDLIIDRRDGIVDVCEIKFASDRYAISKSYEEELQNKIAVFRSSTSTAKAVHLVMVTTFGIAENSHSSIVQKSLTINDLFE